MKRQEFIKMLSNMGYKFKREGGNHTLYTNGYCIAAIPRHNEIKSHTISLIMRQHKQTLGLLK